MLGGVPPHYSPLGAATPSVECRYLLVLGCVAGCSGVVVDPVLWWSRVALPLLCWRGVAMLGTGQFLGAWSPGTMILAFTRVAGL